MIHGLSPTQNTVPIAVDENGNLLTAPASPSTTATGLSLFRSLLVDSTAVAVKASAGNVYGLNITNRHSAAIAVKLYNKAAAGVNPASDVPQHVFLVQANGSLVLRGADLPFSFATAIAVRCVTELTDTGTTAPATLPIIELDYK